MQNEMITKNFNKFAYLVNFSYYYQVSVQAQVKTPGHLIHIF